MIYVHGFFSGSIIAAILALLFGEADIALVWTGVSCAGFLGMLTWRHGL